MLLFTHMVGAVPARAGPRDPMGTRPSPARWSDSSVSTQEYLPAFVFFPISQQFAPLQHIGGFGVFLCQSKNFCNFSQIFSWISISRALPPPLCGAPVQTWMGGGKPGSPKRHEKETKYLKVWNLAQKCISCGSSSCSSSIEMQVIFFLISFWLALLKVTFDYIKISCLSSRNSRNVPIKGNNIAGKFVYWVIQQPPKNSKTLAQGAGGNVGLLCQGISNFQNVSKMKPNQIEYLPT